MASDELGFGKGVAMIAESLDASRPKTCHSFSLDGFRPASLVSSFDPMISFFFHSIRSLSTSAPLASWISGLSWRGGG